MIDFMQFRKNRAMRPDPQVEISEASFTVLDTELTGLDERKDSLVSVGAVRMTGGRVDLGRSFYKLINPEAKLTESSVVIHRITPGEVCEKPPVSSVLSDLMDFIESDILVGFCISIDMEFLNRDAKRCLGRLIRNNVLDIKPLYEWAIGREERKNGTAVTVPPRYRLYDIAKHYGIEMSNAHNAIMDAFVTAQIFQRFIPVFAGAGITRVGDLMKLSDRLKGGDRFTA